MTVLLMVAAALAAPPRFDDVTIGAETPASYDGMCGPIGPNLFRCQAAQRVVGEVKGSMAIERCGINVHTVKFVSLIVPGSGHDLPMATVSKNVLEDARRDFDRLTAYFTAQGFKIDDPGVMGPAKVETTHEGVRLSLEMGPLTDIPELPKGAWQAGIVLTQEAPCK